MVRRKETDEERRAKNLIFQTNEKLRYYRDGMPVVRKFEIGEKVQIGNLDDVIIKESVEGGKVYIVEHDALGRETGRRLSPFHWYDIFHFNENEHMFTDGYGLNYYNTSFNNLISALMMNWLDMEPEYQRGYVWELADKVYFIDSLFKQREIGRFIVRSKPENRTGTHKDEIVDGKQRLNAVYEFMLDKFRYNGLLWSELHPLDRTRMKQAGILLCKLDSGTTDEQVLRIFIDSNTTGKVMSKEHLEMLEKRYQEIVKMKGE